MAAESEQVVVVPETVAELDFELGLEVVESVSPEATVVVPVAAESVQAVVVPEVEFEVAEQSEQELNFEPEVVVVELAESAVTIATVTEAVDFELISPDL